jgi:predicted ATPase/class 3 adenylate cyclase
VVELPSGTVTLLFTEVDGSPALLEQLGDAYAAILADHRHLLHDAIQAHRGMQVDSQGDAFFFVFSRAQDAVLATRDVQRAFALHRWPPGAPVRVRMSLHSGEPSLTGGSYVGLDVHRAARLCVAGHGGQVLVSQTTRELVLDELPSDVSLRDLGEHQLKDLQRPEHIFQLVIAGLPVDFPRLKTLATKPNNLPRQTTPLVGREAELAEAQERLLRSDVRLLTLTGPGGTGKTRLGVQLAANVLDHFDDGVCYAQLAPVSDPAMVAPAIAQPLGIRETAARPVLDGLRGYLRDKHMLLCLDNFEHVLPAAPLVGELLATCQRLKVLVTSRALLHVYGEHDFEVPPLVLPARGEAMPSLEHLTRFESVRLFVERAQAVQSDFAVTERSGRAVVEICHRLDGLPLGIELAAARVRLLPPEAMVVRMERRLPLLTGGARDLPRRHQTLRNAIAWSFDLLDEAEQTLFRRLPVFVGGCTLDAVEAVCGGWETGVRSEVPRGIESPTPDTRVLSPINVLEGVESLLDKSLVRNQQTASGDPRLLMLETIREYALEHMDASGEGAEIRRRHAVYFVELAEAAAPELNGPDQVVWRDRLDAELDNVRTVVAWSQADPSRSELGLRLAAALVRHWMTSGLYAEGYRALAAGLNASGPIAPHVRIKALTAAGQLIQLQHEFERATLLLEESLALAEAERDERGVAAALSLLGETAAFQGDFPRATALLEDSLARHRQLGDRLGTHHTLYRLAESATAQHKLDLAASLHEQSLAMRREMGDLRGAATCLKSLADLALERGDHAAASRHYREAVAIYRTVKLKLGIVGCIEGLAGIALATNQPRTAARLLGAAEATVELMGATFHWGARARFERDLAATRARLDEGAFQAARAEGRSMSLEQAIADALGESELTGPTA